MGSRNILNCHGIHVGDMNSLSASRKPPSGSFLENENFAYAEVLICAGQIHRKITDDVNFGC